MPGLGLKLKHVEQCWAGVRPLTEDAQRPMGARERKVHDLAPQGFENVLAMTAGPVMSLRSAGRRMLSEVAARIGPPKARATVGLGHTTQAPTDAVTLAVTHEHAPDLYAVLARRTGAIWSGMVSREDATQTADTIAPLFGWTDIRKASEIEAFLKRQETEFCVPRHDRKRPDQPAMRP